MVKIYSFTSCTFMSKGSCLARRTTLLYKERIFFRSVWIFLRLNYFTNRQTDGTEEGLFLQDWGFSEFKYALEEYHFKNFCSDSRKIWIVASSICIDEGLPVGLIWDEIRRFLQRSTLHRICYELKNRAVTKN